MVHTDIKHDNIFFSTAMTADDIEAWVTKEPSRRHAPEASIDGVVQVAVSQPLPMISEDEAMRATYVLADFGCGTCSYPTLFNSDDHNIFQRNVRTSITAPRSQHSLYGRRRYTSEQPGTCLWTFGLSVV